MIPSSILEKEVCRRALETTRREAMVIARDLLKMKLRCKSELEWWKCWLKDKPADDDSTFRRINRLTRFAEHIGSKRLEDLNNAELIELDRAFWSK